MARPEGRSRGLVHPASDSFRLPARCRQSVKIADRNDPLSAFAADANGGIERGEGDAHIGRMNGNTSVARSKNGMSAIDAIDGAAAGSRRTLIALRKSRIHK